MLTHLEEANESYFEHMKSSLSFSLKSFKACIYFTIHSIFPNIFTSSGSTEIFELVDILEKKLNTQINEKKNNN